MLAKLCKKQKIPIKFNEKMTNSEETKARMWNKNVKVDTFLELQNKISTKS